MASSCGLGGGCFAVHFPWVRGLIVAMAATVALVGQSFGGTPESTKSDVDQLVVAAAHAEISGDVSKSFALLHDAIRINPENQLARWRLGQIKVDKQWVTVEEAHAARRRTRFRPNTASGALPLPTIRKVNWRWRNGVARKD